MFSVTPGTTTPRRCSTPHRPAPRRPARWSCRHFVGCPQCLARAFLPPPLTAQHREEKSIPDAIRALRGCLAHVHISENDRSTPGAGNVRWDSNFDTLNEIGYDNLLVIEAFGLALEKLVPATKIWRRMYQSERQLATDGLNFMKAEVAKRWK